MVLRADSVDAWDGDRSVTDRSSISGRDAGRTLLATARHMTETMLNCILVDEGKIDLTEIC